MPANKSHTALVAERRAALESATKATRATDRRARSLAAAGLGAALLMLVAAVVFILSNTPATRLGEVPQPATANAAGAIVLGTGGLGSPNDGAPTVEIYSDYMCSFCAQFDGINGQDLADLAAAGDIELNYHLLSILDSHTSTQYSTRAANAAATVAHAAPDAFVTFHTVLFAQQPAGDPDGLSDSELEALATTAGVPAAVTATFADRSYSAFAGATTVAAGEAGVTSTPTVVIDGVVMDPTLYNWTEPGALDRAIAELAS